MFSTSTSTIEPTLYQSAHALRILCAGATDTGLARAHNEDRFGVFPELSLFVIADGMGGAVAGEVAAQMAVEQLHAALAQRDMPWPVGMTASSRAGWECLVAGIERANYEVHAASLQRPELRGMGTTIAAVLARGHRAAVAHVGDSRVYRLRGRALHQLTEDHSWLNELVRRGILDPDRADQFEHRNVITRAIGAEPTVDVEARLIDIAPGDTLLLCTDGLCGVLSRGELTDILVAHADPEQAVERLIRRANERGGPDNITAIVLRWELLDAPTGAHSNITRASTSGGRNGE